MTEAIRDMPDDEIRARFRAFLERHVPPHMRDPTDRLRHEESRWWLRTQYEAGWRAPGWPAEHGGMGLSLAQQLLLKEEGERFGLTRVVDMGVTMLGPVLMRYGTPEQKAYILPRILQVEDVWCQGYSEPGAGSDLAGLRCVARRDGDDFVVDGSKIWTTHATDSTHIFTLVRTARREKKQEGISFLLIPLNTPGITVRPIVNLAGEDEFAEVFFTAVRVPAANLVGEEDAGWTVAKALLGFERIGIGNPAPARHALRTLNQAMHALGLHAESVFHDRFVQLEADLHDTEVLYGEVVEAALAGTAGPDQFSMSKLLATELYQRITEFAMEAVGEHAGVQGPARIGDSSPNLYKQFMLSRPGTIYGGTSEVMRNMLAKSMLGLPGSGPSRR